MLILSLRNMGKIKKIASIYNNHGTPDWSSFETKLCVSTAKFFIKKGWVEETKDYKKLFNDVYIKASSLNSVRIKIIENIISKDRELKMFMYFHSIFEIFPDKDDWFESLMKKILQISKEELYNYFKEKEVPKEYIDKFKILDVEPVFFSKQTISPMAEQT